MKITGNVRKCIAKEATIAARTMEKKEEFAEKGADVNA